MTTKNILLFLICSISLYACGNSKTNKGEQISKSDSAIYDKESLNLDSIKGAYLKLDRNREEFGTISKKQKPQLSFDFYFENKGKSPLVILKTDVSCGCVSVIYPKDPILPGDKQKLTINVDTKDQLGAFNKSIFVKTNAENDVELIKLVGEVKE